MALRILRLRGVLDRTGNKKSKHYCDIDKELFTPPVPMGPRLVGWPEHEVDAIIASRIAGWSNDEIRSLVRQLVAQRASLAANLIEGVQPLKQAVAEQAETQCSRAVELLGIGPPQGRPT